MDLPLAGTVVLEFKTKEVGGVEAARDLVDLVLARGAGDLVKCLTGLQDRREGDFV
jgi:hypothetical protein